MKFWNRIISFVLALSMVLSMIPGGTIHAHAEESTHEDHTHGEQSQEAPSSETAEAHTHTYENGICTGCGTEDPDGLKLDGLNVLCLGDSITAGQGLTTDTRWTNVLASKYGWNLTNKSQGGISLSSYYYTANGKSDVSIAKKAEVLKTMTTKPDVIIVWGGHNDTSYRYSPLGTWDDETTDSFKGALKYIAELADEYAPDATLFVLTPLWNNENPSTLKVPEGTTDTNWMFVDAIYDGAEAYGWIPINMDLCGITPFTKTGLLLDNIHPNEAGTEKIVEYLSEELASYGANSRKQTILFNHSSVSIENGKTTTLKAVLSPRSGNGSSVFTWSSSNSSVATVDANGKITAVAHGNTTITVTADNDVSATVRVSVAEGEHTYESTVTAPTCTEQGYTTYTCTCGDSYVDSYTDALGHSYQNRVCTICGAEAPALAGKTISILGASISTFAGTSNGAAADTTNSTIRNNVKYYPNATVTDVTLNDTWWMQVCDDLGLRLLVNNSWSGSSLLYERNGTVGAYVDRCVQLHDDTGDNAGEMPDIIGIQMGTNDFQYYKDTLGTADIDYDALITANGDGTYTYATPVTSLEAAAIVLHKISVRYPDAEVYYLNISQRVDGTDELIRSFNADLKQVVEHFGAHIVDIYGSAITMEAFDTYIGDGRVHPNCLGMDAYTEAFKRALVENTGYRVETHTVSLDLDGVTADYGDDKLVVDGDSFTVKLTASDSLQVTVTMGGEDITASTYANGTVTIGAVTADVTVTARSVYIPKNYRWEFDGTDLVCVSGGNTLTKNAGTTTDGVFSKTRYALETAVLLSHDRPWVVEWKCQGTFLNSNGSSGARIFTSTDVNAEYNARYIFKSNTNGIIAMGEKTSTGSHNYGIALADHGIDWTQLHTYRLENRIAEDGSNMVWLYVDGVEIGPMVNYYVGTTDKKTTSDWLSGKDFVFPYMGTDTHGFSNAKIDFIAVWENGHIHTYENGICTSCGAEDPNAVTETLSLRYDDHYDVTGKTVEIIDAGEAVLAVEGNYLVATGIGQGKVRIDGTLYEVTVEKAKISIVVIMGQSNAGNHFANATSDVTCPLGTAYWWKNGATEPVDYTQPSMGFHTPLVAELYAQSVAAGDPVKNVMVWQEGVTSKNGQSIVKWAASETDTSGTDGTATMIKNCIAYYEKNSDLYEIVNCGVYWLQGESDVSMSPEKYTGLFMAMWNKLKDAGAEYLAFFRVRCGTTGNTSEHHDLGYTGSLTAQLQMINDNADMFMASTVTENWEGNETTEHSVDIRNYITLMEEYGTADTINDSYGNAATIKDGILTTTMKTLYGSNNKCHYGKFGYGIIGADAAYNMYHALHTGEFSVVQTDTSGKATAATISKPGAAVTIDITEMTENLAFRASCGSAAGTLAIKVESGNEDITEKVIANETNTYGTVDTEILREYDNVVITVMYNPVFGTSGSIVYSIVDNSPEPPKMYFWDFENDLNARDENGEVVNSFGETALNGSYVIENGMLKGNSLQLALGKQLKLCGDENWSIEWKFGEVTANTTGFLLCNTAKSAIGTKAVYFSIVGNVMVSDYKNSKGYYNYFTEEATFASGDCIKITNTYDSENGKSVLSLWKNGKLIVSDLQKKGYINSSTYGTYDMSTYPLSGDFVFNYLGCTGLQYFPVTGEIDYLKIIPEEENAESLSLRYDDHYDVTGKVVEIIDAGTPTSYKVGYGVAEGTLDDAVVTLEGNYLVATGIGTAKVRIDGTLYEVTVTAAPISLLLLIGQSNMRGSEGNANQSIVCPDGMVYATYGDDRGADNTAMTVNNATKFAPSALTGEYSSINVEGTTDCLSGYPVYSLTAAGAGKIGPDSGFAYEWVKQTGEKVWIVNAAHGGTSINVWQPGTTEYEQCQALFTACQETLRKEIAAGHFTLSHMAYFWCQGCSDRTQSAQWYVNKYLAMHNGLKTEMAFDHDSNPDTADKAFEFGGIIPVRVGSTASCYRDGVYSVSNPYSYHESFVDLRFSGPRVAQYWMINNPDLPDIWGVCNIGEDWVWMPDGTNGVSAYFQAHYPNGTVDYTPQVAQKASWYTPTTPAAVHDSIHYNQIGYNEIGRESVRNALIMLGEIAAPNVETTVELLTWDGYTQASQIVASTTGNSGTLVVPKVYPIWNSKQVTYTLSDGLTWNYYDLLATDVQTGGTLTAVGAVGSVSVIKAEPGLHFRDHLSQLPEEVCCGLNLWNVLEHDPYYYASGNGWGIYSSGGVCSVTILVNPGDLIYATSLGAAGSNGHSSTNGIRTTFFSEYGIAKTMTPAEVYAEFSSNGGYIVAPDDAVAINIAMWNDSDDNEIYILNLPHDTTGDICSICGKNSHVHTWSDWETVTEPGPDGPGLEQRTCSCGETETREILSIWQTTNIADHWSELPDDLCSGVNLWEILDHDPKYYVVSKGDWGNHSSRDVPSITVSVNPGDRIYATSFGPASENGHGSANGIRVTWFGINGVIKTTDPAGTYAEFTANGGYLVAPEGAVAVNIPMWGDVADHEIYILNRDHSYENGICLGCGAAHPNLANYQGKVISILGGSNCTFAGYIPVADGFNLEHRARYPQDNLLTDVNETWWMQVIQALNTKLGINDSWAGSQVLNTLDTNSGDLGPDAAMASLTRIQNLGANGTPDVILFFGGCNDMGRGVTLGSFDPATAPTQADLTATKWDSFADAYVAAITRMQHFYPDAKILVMLPYNSPTYFTASKVEKYGAVIRAICDHYGVSYVDLRDCGINSDHLPDNIHPNAEGSDYITAAVLDALLSGVDLEAGENVVHSVTHVLSGAESSLGYYKGVSHGKPFVTTLSGEDLTVTVTMGGLDITATAWKNGTVTVPAVTGDLVITAIGRVKTVYEDYLQQLPDSICGGTNLWPMLDHDNEYYTANGWGNNANNIYSVTIPVQPGDQIWATSFDVQSVNKLSGNGTRITWFDKNGVLESVTRDVVYAEFVANGYITVPEGAVAVNIPMASDADSWELYILNLPHNYTSAITEPTCTEQGYTTHTCTVCGDSYVDSYVPATGQHTYGDWVAVTVPTETALGLDQRSCSVCGHTETREVEGSWQKYDLAAHLLELPKNVCCDTNLWPILPHEDVHFTSGKTWGRTGTPTTSITIPLNPGDLVYATSWNKAGENGHDVQNGIRLTFFDAYGIALTLGPGESYSKFAANGGYLEAPEGTIAINIVMWYDSADYEVFILNREHAYEQVTVDPTCTERGYTGTVCLGCGAGTIDSYVDALGHDLTDFAAKSPTCTEIGWNAYETCSRCDYTTYQELPAVGHSYGAWIQVTAPTCNAEGRDKSICQNCSEIIYRDTRISGDPNKIMVSNPLAENWFEGKIIMAIGDSLTAGSGVTVEERYHYLTAQTLGMTNINCGTSGATLCPGGHLPNKFETWMNAKELIKRDVDIVTIFLGINDWDNGVVNGTYQGKLKYDESLTYYDLGEFGTDDTTTIYGAAKMWCERILELQATEGCEHIQFVFITPVITSYNKSVTNARDWNQNKVNVFGYTLRQYCTAIMEVCAYYNIPVLDQNMYSGMYYHSEEDNNVAYFGGDGIHPGANGHAMMAESLVEFLLEGYTYEERTVADCGHDYEEIITDPTCTEGGYTTYRCPACYYSYVGNHTQPTGHDYKSVVTAPTCTEQGYTTHTCTVCGDSYIDSYVNTTGHKFGNWFVTKAATCTEDGQEQRDCANCDHYETRTVEATGHDYKSVVTDPTCTERGYTTHTCTLCGHSYVDSYVNQTGHKFGNWYVTKNASCTEDGQERRDCANCDHFETRTIEATGHDYKSVVTEPTCTEQGYTTHNCANCGDSYVDSYVSPTGHKFGNWYVTKNATCTEDGSERRDCANCDHYETRVIDATGHDYRSVVTAPTCTERGYTTHTCSVCGDSYVDSYVDATGHKFGNWIVTKAATCTEDGTERRDCENCDHYETRTIEATGHNYKSVVTAPTCTEQGYTTHTCAKCGDSYVDSYVDATGHKFGNWYVTKAATCEEEGTERRDCANCDHYETRTITATGHNYKSVVTAPTCTEQGYTTHTCTVCGDSYVDSWVNATGHKFDSWVVTKEATCTEDGQERRDCQNCDHYETRTIEATGHDYKSVVTAPTCTEQGYTTHTCTVCGNSYLDSYVNPTGHKFGNWFVTKAATCTEDGQERRDCANCDHYETRVVEATGHNYKSVVTAPTCTERGYTTHTCTNCGHSYVDSYVSPTGHKFGNWYVTKNATCTEDGQERRDCANCDHYETRTIKATGHDYKSVVTAPTCTEQGYTTHTCAKCGNSYVDSPTPALGHSYGEWYQTKAPTYEADGEERRDCTRCDHYQTRVVPMLKHEYVSVVTDPTCTEQGYTTHTCTKCGDTYVDTFVPALGHNFVTYVSDGNATCTEDGTKTAKCERCDATDTVIDRGSATGHKFGSWVVTKAATCTEDGTERRDCQNCDHYETRTIEATGHNYKSVVTAPTCTERGYTTHNCTKCGHSYTDSYVNATGHKFGNWFVTKAATCTEDGQERRDCQNCDHYETRTIEAAGHSYKSVVTAPTCTEQGYTTHTCANCGHSYVDSYVNPTGHKFGPWEITKEPETGKKGQRQRSCKVCGHVETEEIPALDFQYGDCNGDGTVNGKDLILLRQSLAGWDVELDEAAADCNGDGEVNGKDLILLRQYLAGWDVTLGPRE